MIEGKSVSRWLSQWVGLIIFERVGGRWMSRSETRKSVGTDSATFESQKVVPIDFVVYCSVKRVTSLHLNYFGGSSENWLIPLKKRRLCNHICCIISYNRSASIRTIDVAHCSAAQMRKCSDAAFSKRSWNPAGMPLCTKSTPPLYGVLEFGQICLCRMNLC